MTSYAIVCALECGPELFREYTSNIEDALKIYERPFDEAYILKLSRRYPDCKGVRVYLNSREHSDWVEVKYKFEPIL